jgi:hypothetical protein
MAGELVLLHNSMREKDMISLNKHAFRWLRPYRVVKANPEMRSYVLAEINGAELGGTVAENRLKRFFPRPEGFTVTASGSKHTAQEDLEST